MSGCNDGTTVNLFVQLASSGYHNVQLINQITGASNTAGFTVPGDITQPSIKIISPIASTTLTSKTLAVSGTCSNYSGSMDVYYYSDKREDKQNLQLLFPFFLEARHKYLTDLDSVHEYLLLVEILLFYNQEQQVYCLLCLSFE